MHNAAHYLAKSYTRLNAHNAAGQFDTQAALRLLRRNARDIAPHASALKVQAIARQLLQSWRNGAKPTEAIRLASKQWSKL